MDTFGTVLTVWFGFSSLINGIVAITGKSVQDRLTAVVSMAVALTVIYYIRTH